MAMGAADEVGGVSVQPPLAVQTTWWKGKRTATPGSTEHLVAKGE